MIRDITKELESRYDCRLVRLTGGFTNNTFLMEGAIDSGSVLIVIPQFESIFKEKCDLNYPSIPKCKNNNKKCTIFLHT